MTKKQPLLIDTDPGVDDALALLMAFDSPRHDVVALTIAAGNVGRVRKARVMSAFLFRLFLFFFVS